MKEPTQTTFNAPSLDIRVEAALFYKAAPMKCSALAKFFEVSEDDVREACKVLSERLSAGATRLITTEQEVDLVTAPELADVVESLRKDELRRDIGRAGAETLAIVLYRGPISRAEIDRIRGVNSAFILRNLMIRGLVEREAHATDARSFQYLITPSLLAHLGITHREELPEFETILTALDEFEKNQPRAETEAEPTVFAPQ